MRRVVSEPLYDSGTLSCISQSINTAILNCPACTFSFELRFRLAYKIGSRVLAVECCEQFLRLRFRTMTRQTITHPTGTRLARFWVFASCVKVTCNVAKQSSRVDSHSTFYDNDLDHRCRGQKTHHQEAADPRLRWIALFVPIVYWIAS
jgi:hypothetical protein